MTRNSNLVPTAIVDKNGKTTTVHKLPAESTAVRTMPVPALKPKRQLTLKELRETARALVDDCIEFESEFDRRQVSRHLETYSADSLQKLIPLLQREDDTAFYAASQIIGNESARFIVDCAHYVPMLDIKDFGEAAAIVRSLREYQQFEHEPDLSALTPEKELQCLTVLKATNLLNPKGNARYEEGCPLDFVSTFTDWDMPIIKNRELATFLMENPDDLHTICEVVNKHHVTEPNAILGIMDGIVPALAEGTL